MLKGPLQLQQDKKEDFTISSLYQKGTMSQLDGIFNLSEDIIKNLDECALNELLGGYSYDIDKLFLDVVQECSWMFLSGDSVQTSSFNYLEGLTNCLDNMLNDLSLAYFVSNMLEDFEIAPYHLEWANLAQIYPKLCILAARNHSKSYFFSFAFIIWKMWKYKGGKRDKEILLITNEHSLAKHFLDLIREAIEGQVLLRDILFPGAKAIDWGKEKITTKNKCTLVVKGSGSAMRGLHMDTIVVDDYLTELDMYNAEIRSQSIDFFNSVILNILNPGGQINVVGCVTKDTLVLEKEKGFNNIIELAPKEVNLQDKGLYKSLDFICDSFGNFEESVSYYVNGLCETKRVILENKNEITGSLIHPLWKFFEDGHQDWCKIPDLKIGDIIEIKDNREIENWGSEQEIKGVPQIPYSEKINLPTYINEDIAYFLGLYVAEGNLHKNKKQSQITNCEVDISFMEKYNTPFLSYEPGKYLCSRKNFRQWLVSLFGEDCKAHKKFIPEIIMKGTKKNMTAFIQGYMDGDGTSSSEFGIVGCSSVSKKLIYQLKYVLSIGYGIDSNIGFKTKEQVNATRIYDKNIKRKLGNYVIAKHDRWDLKLSAYNSKLFYERIGFRLKRKQDNYKFAQKYSNLDEGLPNPRYLLKQIRELGQINKINSIIPAILFKDTRKYVTRGRLVNIYDYYYKFPAFKDNDLLLKLKEYFSKDWKYITQIEDAGQQYTYDFVIPKHNIFIGNGIKNHQTPMHQEDIYGYLKRAKGWRVFEYPAIDPSSGTVLYPERFSLKELLDKKQSQGSIVFSREILVRPISSATSIFPMEILQKALVPNVEMVYNRYSIPFKIKKIGLGVDLAISANVASDYFVCVTVALDENNRYWILNIFREKGLTYNQQLEVVSRLQNSFQYDKIVVETNGYQEAFYQMLIDKGFTNVVGRKTTSTNKYSSSIGLIGLSALFEQGRIKIPNNQNSVYTVNMASHFISEFNSMTFSNNKIEGVGSHDDIVMATLFGFVAINYINDNLTLSFLEGY